MKKRKGRTFAASSRPPSEAVAAAGWSAARLVHCPLVVAAADASVWQHWGEEEEQSDLYIFSVYNGTIIMARALPGGAAAASATASSSGVAPAGRWQGVYAGSPVSSTWGPQGQGVRGVETMVKSVGGRRIALSEPYELPRGGRSKTPSTPQTAEPRPRRPTAAARAAASASPSRGRVYH